VATAVSQPARVLSAEELANILRVHADYLDNPKADPKKFKRANLSGVNFDGLDLTDAVLDNADLSRTDLRAQRGLKAYQLRGTDLSGAKLPPDIKESLKTLPGVDEATKTSRKVFLIVLAACLYCWLTILSTTDAALLIGNSTLALPIVQTQIPIAAFYGATPVLLLIVYLYLHFSLQNLWDALATLPAVFPDGRPVHERTLPWILSPIVRVYFDRLKDRCPRMAEFQVRATWLLAWWAVPLTLAGFWARFLLLVRDHWLITTLQVVLLAVSVWLAVAFWRITRDTLDGKPPDTDPLYKTLRPLEVLAGVLTGGFLILFSLGCFYGNRPLGEWEWRAAAPNLLSLLGWDAFGDLNGANLSRKPEEWDGRNMDAVKGARLLDTSLKNVNGLAAFGVKAEFGPDLRGANFNSADLRYAKFLGADLTRAQLSGADLRGADFRFARFANQFGAGLAGANIEGADLRNTSGLDAVQIRSANNWMLADFDEDRSAALGLCAKPCDYEERRVRKDFSGMDLSGGNFHQPNLSLANLRHTRMDFNDLSDSNLSEADLRDVNWSNVHLTGADLTDADLRGTDLRKLLGLTRTQIESAMTDDKTQLPDYLEKQRPFGRFK
jgi:uncharacterized protein YjbI with pentapeptide repeats